MFQIAMMAQKLQHQQMAERRKELNAIYQKFLAEFTFSDGTHLPTPESYIYISFNNKRFFFIDKNLEKGFDLVMKALNFLEKIKTLEQHSFIVKALTHNIFINYISSIIRDSFEKKLDQQKLVIPFFEAILLSTQAYHAKHVDTGAREAPYFKEAIDKLLEARNKFIESYKSLAISEATSRIYSDLGLTPSTSHTSVSSSSPLNTQLSKLNSVESLAYNKLLREAGGYEFLRTPKQEYLHVNEKNGLQLTDAMWLQIFGFLDTTSLIFMMRAGKNFTHIANDIHIRERFYNEKPARVLKSFLQQKPDNSSATTIEHNSSLPRPSRTFPL